MAELDLSVFTSPKVYYNEITIPAGGTAEIDQELYKLSEKMLIDYLWVGEESLTVNGAAPVAPYAVTCHTSRIEMIDLWWYISTRRESALRLRNAFDYYTFAEAKRWSVYSTTLPQDNAGQPVLDGNIVWRFLRPWRYVPGCGLLVEWNYVNGQLVPGGGSLRIVPATDVVLYGIGTRTGHRRIFEVQVPALNPNPPALNPLQGATTNSEFVMNQTDEPYDVDTMVIRIQTDAQTNVGWTDARQLHMMRYRIRPTIGKPFSEIAVPLAAFGIDVGPLRGVHYQPTGGPLILEEGSAIGWRLTNNSNANLRVQVALIGRVQPGRW